MPKKKPRRLARCFRRILYLVRCNLVRGSKAEMGDDEQVIEASVDPLKRLLEKAIEPTDKQLSNRGVT
jgi:hypothetical protein